MSEIHDSDLYAAATNALASEASAINTFEKIVSFAMSCLDVSDFKTQLYDVEKVIKEEYSLTSMPSPWRSAKSVCLSAFSFGISFLNENSVPKGKTRLQAEIKAATSTESEETPWNKAMKGANIIARNFSSLTPKEQESLKSLVARFS